MTIAAGFCHRDGVILCADTQHEAGYTKSYEPKLVEFQTPSGANCAFAYAGNTNFALSTIYKAIRKMQKAHAQDEALDILEGVLDAEYKRVVLSNPNHTSDENLHYYLLLALPDGDRMTLYSSYWNTVKIAPEFECVGIGETFAKHVIGLYPCPLPSERQAANIASYALEMVKLNVPGCGGPSQFISLRHDGTRSDGYHDKHLMMIERAGAMFNKESRHVFMEIFEDDANYEGRIHRFSENMKGMKSLWDGEKTTDPPVDLRD